MKIASVKLFILLVATSSLAASCGHNRPAEGNNNPVFKSPQLKDISEKINDHPKDADLYYQRGQILHRMQIDTLALADFKKAATLDSSKAEYFSAVGDLMFEHKDIDGSVQWLKRALALNPSDKKAHLKMAKMFLYMKDYPKAFGEINTVLRQDPHNGEGYFLKGMVYKDLNDTAKALSNLQTAVQEVPDYREAMIELAQVYSMQSNPIALKYYDNAFKLDTGDAFPLFARGVYFQAQGDVETAKKEYRNCIYHDPAYADAFYNMGYILMQQDSTEKAWRQFDLAIKTAPDYAAAYYNRGLCSEIMHKKNEAIQDYRQALVFDTGYKDPKMALARLGASR